MYFRDLRGDRGVGESVIHRDHITCIMVQAFDVSPVIIGRHQVDVFVELHVIYYGFGYFGPDFSVRRIRYDYIEFHIF